MTWSDHEAELSEAVNENLTVPVTYRQRTIGALDSATMTRAKSDTDTPVDAVRGREEIDFDTNGAKISVVTYDCLASQFSARPESGDLVVDGSTERRVRNVKMSVDQLWYKLETYRKL